jgi:hypothetical protein
METHSLEYRDLNDFYSWILSIGSGTITHGYSIDKNSDPDSIIVELPEDLLINTTGNKIEALMTNEIVDEIMITC